MDPVAWFVTFELGNKQVNRCRNRQFQFADLFLHCSQFPFSGQFTQDILRHEVNMPAVYALEFAADECLVTMTGNFVAISYGVNVHAGFRQFGGEAAFMCMPEKRR